MVEVVIFWVLVTERGTLVELGTTFEVGIGEELAEIVEVIVGTDTEILEYRAELDELEEGTETGIEVNDITGLDDCTGIDALATEPEEEDE